MKKLFNKQELEIIYDSLHASKEILDDVITIKELKSNLDEYFKYSDYLAQINLLMEKIKRYLNEHTN